RRDRVDVAVTYRGDGAPAQRAPAGQRSGQVGDGRGDEQQEQVDPHGAGASTSVISRSSSRLTAPARTRRSVSPVASTMLDATWPGASPASRYTDTESPSWSYAACALTAA